MNHTINILAFCGVVAVGGALFRIKYDVIDMENRLKHIQEKTELTKESIKVLQAEWGYLNNPTRLQRLAEKYLHILPPEKKTAKTHSSSGVIRTTYHKQRDQAEGY